MATTTMREMMKQLDDGNMYYRKLSVNGTQYPHTEGTETHSGFYINGVEFFKAGQFYWLKVFTSWNTKVYINEMYKINSKGKILRFYLNLFGLTEGNCVLVKEPKMLQEAPETLAEWIGIINECIDTDDEERKVILTERTALKPTTCINTIKE